MELANGNVVSIPISEEPNSNRSIGLKYEAEAVRLAIGDGLLEHPLMTLDQSLLIADIVDEVKQQIGYC